MEQLLGKSYYELLGVERSASTEQIRDAYKEIARVYHPDSNYYQDLVDYEVKGDQVEMFKAITAAYHTLSNREKRAAYDKTLPPDLRGWVDTPSFTAEDAQIEEYLAKLGVDPASIGVSLPKRGTQPQPRVRKNSAAYGIFGTLSQSAEVEAAVVSPQFSSTAFSHGEYGVVRQKRPTLTGIIRPESPEDFEPAPRRKPTTTSMKKPTLDAQPDPERTRLILFFFGGLSAFLFAASVVTFVLIG